MRHTGFSQSLDEASMHASVLEPGPLGGKVASGWAATPRGEALGGKVASLKSASDALLLIASQAFSPFFFTLVTGPRRSLSLELSDRRVYAPQIRARFPGKSFNFQLRVVHPGLIT